ncbi:MAG: rhodanese-like domain-containing protein [Chitinophagales bacterium]
MKNLIMLFALAFSFATLNAQEASSKTKKECTKTKAECTKSKKECTKSKKECTKAKAEGKTCSKSANAKACCDKSKAGAKTCSKSSEVKACCDKSKSASKSCSGSTAAYSKTVNAKDFMTYADKFPSEQIIDIRTAQEVKSTGTIASAINIDYNNSDDFKMKMNALDKNTAVMIYCQSGKRSAEAVKLMKMWGFKKIYEMEGGFKAYKTAFPKG